MKLKRSIILGVTALSFWGAIALTPTTAQAYSTYRSVPRAIRGYYIGNDRISMITGHRIVYGMPQADAYSYKVTRVNRSGHFYHIHAFMYYGQRVNMNFKISHTSKYKIRVGNVHMHKVSKSSYYWYANHGVTG